MVKVEDVYDIIDAIKQRGSSKEIEIETIGLVAEQAMNLLAEAFPLSGSPTGVLGRAVAEAASGGTIGAAALSAFLVGIGVSTGQVWLVAGAVALAILIVVVMANEIVVEYDAKGKFRIIIRKKSIPE